MSLLKEVTEEKVRNATSHSLQDDKGDWYIKDDLQKKDFKAYAEAHILKNKLSSDPRIGLNRVFMWDKKTSAWDEKVIRDYNKFAQQIAIKSKVQLFLINNQNELAKFLKQFLNYKSMVIGMGAGSISSWIKELPRLMRK